MTIQDVFEETNENQLPEESIVEPCEHINELEPKDLEEMTRALPRGSLLLRDVNSCSTAVVNGLSQQLIDEMNVLVPNILVKFDELNVSVGPAVWSYLQRPAREALARAIADRGVTMRVNSAYRTIAQQLILYNHSRKRQCGITLAARPGASNHQSGLALDIQDPQGWRPFLERHGWRWLGPSDPPHFDYVRGGTRDIRSLAIRAFQRLWTKNNLNDPLGDDGVYGAQTEQRLNRSPIEGFGNLPAGGGARILRLSEPLMQGDDVREVQQALVKAGFQLEVDGFFGQATEAIVRQFQQREGLTADGIFGAASRTKLLKPKL